MACDIDNFSFTLLKYSVTYLLCSTLSITFFALPAMNLTSYVNATLQTIRAELSCSYEAYSFVHIIFVAAA
jgi:hypothetical protein